MLSPHGAAPRITPPVPSSAGTTEIALWARIVRSPAASPMLRAVLTNSSLVELKETAAVLSCPARFAPGARSRLTELAGVFERELGRRIEVRVVESEGGAAHEPSSPPPADERPHAAASGAPIQPAPEPAADPLAAPQDDPLVKLAIELFEARIVSIQPQRPPRG